MIALLTLNKNWPIFMVVGSIFFGWAVAKRTHWSVGVFTGIYLCEAFSGPSGPTPALILMMMAAPFLVLQEAHRLAVKRLLWILCLASIVTTLTVTTYGLSGNPSMNGCLIAITMPFLVQRALRWHWLACYAVVVLSAICCFVVDASIPVGALSITLASALFWMMYQDNQRLRALVVRALITSIVVFIPLAVIGYLINPSQFLSSTGRYWIWKEVLSLSWNGTFWFGRGTGALSQYFEQLRVTNPLYKTIIWAHNDFLQVLYDNGIVGLISLLIACAFTVRQAFQRWSAMVFMALMGYLATMFFNFPVHVPVHAMVGVMLVWLSWLDHAVDSDCV